MTKKVNTDNAIIVLNAGSSSLKFGLYSASNKNAYCFTQGSISNINDVHGHSPSFEIKHTKYFKPIVESLVQIKTHTQALAFILNWLEENYPVNKIVAAGHRVVHGGGEFSQALILDPQIINKLHGFIPLAPLHMPHNLAVIAALLQQQPALLQIACFDTAFHHSMGWNEQHYALPLAWFDKGVRRYGFHGLSYEYIASILKNYVAESAHKKVIVAHLGHGASLCALHQGKSVATTMGFTPLDGIPMATRPGELDSGVISWLMREGDLSIEQVDDLLNHQSGLLGLSGLSGDMRVLLESDDEAATRAVDYFVHHTHRAIASLAAVMGGLDALVFTAGIGENSATIREQVCAKARWLGVNIDLAANHEYHHRLSTVDSPVSVWTIPTDEQSIIAEHSRALITNQNNET
ncbi:Acetate kinase [hydrothermal vent metagenome]|uniref:Acetate kinase n=1 Tax=hydrothermal vent metagenome TaxID=652676 RepID=A0A3B0XEK3_9ZZZZ